MKMKKAPGPFRLREHLRAKISVREVKFLQRQVRNRLAAVWRDVVVHGADRADIEALPELAFHEGHDGVAGST